MRAAVPAQPRRRAPLPARGAAGRPDGPPCDRADPRLRAARRPAVLRDAARPGHEPARVPAPGGGAPRRRARRRHPGGRGARVLPRPRRRAPRHQAGERDGLARRRLRARAGHGLRPRPRLDREPADPHRHAGGHARLPEPRAGGRARRGRPLRRLRARDDALRVRRRRRRRSRARRSRCSTGSCTSSRARRASGGAEIDEELERIVLACLAKEAPRRPRARRARRRPQALPVAPARERPRARRGRADRDDPRPAPGAWHRSSGARAELAELQKRLNAALDGECQLVVVSGEPGSARRGCSTRSRASPGARGIRALHGRSVEQDRSFAYQGFCDAIQEYFRYKDSRQLGGARLLGPRARPARAVPDAPRDRGDPRRRGHERRAAAGLGRAGREPDPGLRAARAHADADRRRQAAACW